MKRLTFYAFTLLSLVLSLSQVGCQASAQAATFQPLSISAPDCNGGNLIKSIQAVDESTVKFNLCFSDPDFASKVAFITFAIQDTDYLNEVKGSSVLMSENSVGTGPYVIKRRDANLLVLTANPTYWGVTPGVTEIDFIGKLAPTDRIQLLLNGKADIADSPAVSDLNRVATSTVVTTYNRPALSTIYLGINNTIPPFDNDKVRQAFARAIDRDNMVRVFYPYGGQVADQFIPSILNPGFSNGINWYSTSTADARTLLEEAGYDFNQEIYLAFNADPSAEMTEPFRLATQIQTDLRRVGVRITLRPLVSTDFQNAVKNGEEAFYLTSWNFAPLDALSFYRQHFMEADKAFGVIPQDVKDQINASAQETNTFARQQRYDRINGLLKEYVVGIPLVHFSGTLVINNNVQNVSVTPFKESLTQMNTTVDRIIYVQKNLPVVLWPADETDADTFRIANLLYESLTRFSDEDLSVQPSLAEFWENSPDNTEWTFYLRHEVKFSNGATLDANDVVASFAAQWNVASPNHTGNTGAFTYFRRFFGGFISTDPNISPEQ